jgi:hypothetical protein
MVFSSGRKGIYRIIFKKTAPAFRHLASAGISDA